MHDETEFKWVGDLEKGYPIASKFFEVNKKTDDKVREWQESLGIPHADRLPAAEGMRAVGTVTSQAGIQLAKEKLGLTVSTRSQAS